MAAVSRMSNPERVVITAVLAGVQRRPKQAGSIAPDDNRYCASERDAATGKFIGKKADGRLLDSHTHDRFPTTQNTKEPSHETQ